MTNKERYAGFCEMTYVPVYSKPWWMDAVCTPENWDVWLYESGGEIQAAMPYYLEKRKRGRYITKAPLTQNNGIIFRYPDGQGAIARAKYEERVIREAMSWIDSLGLAVYEQQYQTTFTNWLPFSWLGCDALPRYTYVIENTSDLDAVWGGLSSSYRKNIKKGKRNVAIEQCDDPGLFYGLHAKVFERQGLSVPFSRELFGRLWDASKANASSRALIGRVGGDVASVLFLVWDSRRMYHLLGGTMPGFGAYETYNALAWEGIRLAHEMGLAYDFEGSMIERISKSFREFGGIPELYFRIRKVYSADVICDEIGARLARVNSRAGGPRIT